MFDSKVMFRPMTIVEEAVRQSPSEETLLVAALAATLVEYQRYVSQRSGQRRRADAGSNWRTMARLEQLRV